MDVELFVCAEPAGGIMVGTSPSWAATRSLESASCLISTWTGPSIFDVNLVSANWGGPGPAGDANKDGTVDIFDVNVISSGGISRRQARRGSAEPAGVGLLASGIGLLVLVRRRTARRTAQSPVFVRCVCPIHTARHASGEGLSKEPRLSAG
jgi:hypothetical protein